MKKKFLSILILGFFLIGIAGCGKTESSNISDNLNQLIASLEKESDDFEVNTIQKYLEKNSDYRLIAGQDEEFTEKPSSSKNQYTYVQESEQLINTNSLYVLIYDTKTDKFYNVSITYISYKPYFNEAIELK